jgi:hypothetical protein
MKRTSRTTIALLTLPLSVAALLTACTSGGHPAASPGVAATPTPAPTSATPGNDAAGGGCAAFAALMTKSKSALGSTDPAQLTALAAQDRALGGTFAKPQLNAAATSMSTYFTQVAAYAKNPAGATLPDSTLMTTATQDYTAACASKP